MTEEKTLREHQVWDLLHMLRFNKDAEEDEIVDFKVLVFDKKGYEIISSVLRTADLEKCGVTLYLLLDKSRQTIPVPAIYFIEPSEHNFSRIVEDAKEGLYPGFYLNFTRPLTRLEIEDFAKMSLQTSSAFNSVCEQSTQFVMLEPEVFSLQLPDTYRLLYDPRSNEQVIERRINEIAEGLFCVVTTMRALPIIRASRGNAAEAIAQVLDEKFRGMIPNLKHVMKHRVVLTIIDRNIDLVSMLSHSWRYQSLINDVCELKANTIKSTTVPFKSSTQTYEIVRNDRFWRANHSLPFPEVVDNVESFIKEYKADAQKAHGSYGAEDLVAGLDINEDGGSSGSVSGSGDNKDFKSTTSSMLNAMSAVPELTERKKAVDMHTNIATALLEAIGKRGLAQLFEAEETASRQTPKTILELVKNAEMGTPEDKLRLYLVFYITQQSKSDSKDFTAIESEILECAKSADCESVIANALKYVKRTKEISRMSLASQTPSAPPSSGASSVSPDLFRRFAGSLTEKLNQGVIAEGVGNIMSGLKNFLPENKDLPVTRIVQQLTEPSKGANASGSSASQGSSKSTGSSIADDFLFFDPSEPRGSHTRPPRKHSDYKQAIVFMVGGGNYSEYADVRSKNPGVVYGSTDMPSPHEFVTACAELGEQM